MEDLFSMKADACSLNYLKILFLFLYG